MQKPKIKMTAKENEKDNVVDADFEDVKEKKKKTKKKAPKIIVKETSCGKKRLL